MGVADTVIQSYNESKNNLNTNERNQFLMDIETLGTTVQLNSNTNEVRVSTDTLTGMVRL